MKECGLLDGNIDDLVTKYMMKYRNHSNILIIGEECNRGQEFRFVSSQVDREEILKDLGIWIYQKQAKALTYQQKLWEIVLLHLLIFVTFVLFSFV